MTDEERWEILERAALECDQIEREYLGRASSVPAGPVRDALSAAAQGAADCARAIRAMIGGSE